MSQLAVSTIAAGSGDSGTTVVTNHNANEILLQKNFIDTADPSSPPNGQEWVRSDDVKKYCQIAGAKVEVLWRYRLNATLAALGNEITTLHLEQLATGSLPTPAAGTKAQVCFDSTVSLPVYTSATANYYNGGFNVNASEYVAIPCSLNVAVITGGQTAATADVTTRGAGWLFDATTDELNFVALAPVPSGWTAANSVLAEVEFSLVAAETAGDDNDLDCSWLSLTPGSGDGWDKTKTAAAISAYDCGANVSAQDVHTQRITLVYTDATNPIAAGDRISGYIKKNTVGGAGKVGSVVVHSITILVPCFRGVWA